MVTVVQPQNTWSDIGERFGTGVVQGHQNRSDEMALQKSIGSLPPNASPRQILDAITNTKTYSPEAKQNVLKNYMGQAQFEETKKKAQEIQSAKQAEELNKLNRERENARNIVKQLKLPEEQKAALGESLSQSAAEDLLKAQVKGEGTEKLTPFQKKVQEKNAEDYINLTKEVPKLQNTIENIDHVEELSKTLGAFDMNWLGPLSGLVGTSQAKELEAASFPLIEPIVKTFNPSGPIATQKLKIIQDKYQIKATDTPPAIKGKIAALRRFAKQAYARNNERLKLYEKYDGNPPLNIIESFDQESDTLSDAMMDYEVKGEEVDIPGLPEAKGFKGKTITSPEGEKYFSDGTRWVKK